MGASVAKPKRFVRLFYIRLATIVYLYQILFIKETTQKFVSMPDVIYLYIFGRKYVLTSWQISDSFRDFIYIKRQERRGIVINFIIHLGVSYHVDTSCP